MTTEDQQLDEPLWPMSSRQAAAPEAAQPARQCEAGAADEGMPGPQDKRRPRRRQVALIVAVTVAVALLTAGGIALNLYDEQTKIDRSTPTVAVTQLVDAMFTARDESAVARFSCAEPRLGPLRDLAVAIREQERNSGPQVTVSVESMRLSGRSRVETSLRLAAVTGEDIQSWTFDTVDQGGWRVCAVQRVN